MSWTSECPTLPGFYWFKGTVTFTSATHEVILAMVVELTGAVPYVKVWFPKKDVPIPIDACDGQWYGPLEVPR
jgi:hypothetical protein